MIVLDASALIALVNDEAGADVVGQAVTEDDATISTVGRHVLPRLRDAGYDVRVLSRMPHDPEDGVEYVVGDLATGAGLDPAVDSVETIVHAGDTATGDDVKTLHLVEAAARAGRPHVAYISVVGADRVPVEGVADRRAFGYFEAKRHAERVVAESGLHWSTLRATQFHQSMITMFDAMTRMPVVPTLSGVRFQPVDADEVAERLVQVALNRPAGLVPELAGPRAYPMRDLLRSYLAARGIHRLTMPIRMPGRAFRALRGGAEPQPRASRRPPHREEALADA